MNYSLGEDIGSAEEFVPVALELTEQKLRSSIRTIQDRYKGEMLKLPEQFNAKTNRVLTPQLLTQLINNGQCYSVGPIQRNFGSVVNTVNSRAGQPYPAMNAANRPHAKKKDWPYILAMAFNSSHYSQADLGFSLLNESDPIAFQQLIAFRQYLGKRPIKNLESTYTYTNLEPIPRLWLNFYKEKVMAWVLDRAFELKRTTMIEDESFAVAWYQTLKSRVTELSASLQTKPNELGRNQVISTVRLHCYKARKAHDGTWIRSGENGYTATGSNNRHDAPEGLWPVVMPYQDARQLKAINDEVASLLVALITELESRIANLQEKGGSVEKTTFSTDETRNPFLVLDTKRSEEAGSPVYSNVARATANLQTPLEIIPERDRRFNIRDIRTAPEVRTRYARIYQTPEGWGSQDDLDTTKGTNWLPWVVAAGVGLTVASQVL